MFAAFILIFWIVWSSSRDVYALSESLWMTIIVVLVQAAMDFQMPLINGHWAAVHLVLWAYAGLALYAANRWAASFMTAVVMGVAAGLGYYWLYGNIGGMVARHMAA